MYPCTFLDDLDATAQVCCMIRPSKNINVPNGKHCQSSMKVTRDYVSPADGNLQMCKCSMQPRGVRHMQRHHGRITPGSSIRPVWGNRLVSTKTTTCQQITEHTTTYEHFCHLSCFFLFFFFVTICEKKNNILSSLHALSVSCFADVHAVLSFMVYVNWFNSYTEDRKGYWSLQSCELSSV